MNSVQYGLADKRLLHLTHDIHSTLSSSLERCISLGAFFVCYCTLQCVWLLVQGYGSGIFTTAALLLIFHTCYILELGLQLRPTGLLRSASQPAFFTNIVAIQPGESYPASLTRAKDYVTRRGGKAMCPTRCTCFLYNYGRGLHPPVISHSLHNHSALLLWLAFLSYTEEPPSFIQVR